MLNISQVILMRTDSNLCRKELTVHRSAPNSLIRSYLQPCTNSMWGDESESVAPFIWLYQIVDAQKEEVFFPYLLITLRSYVEFSDGIEMMHKAKCSIEEVPYCFSRSSVKFEGLTAKQNHRFWSKLGVSGLWILFEFTNGYERMDKDWSNIKEVPYCFPRSSIKFQGHTG